MAQMLDRKNSYMIVTVTVIVNMKNTNFMAVYAINFSELKNYRNRSTELGEPSLQS